MVQGISSIPLGKCSFIFRAVTSIIRGHRPIERFGHSWEKFRSLRYKLVIMPIPKARNCILWSEPSKVSVNALLYKALS